MPAGFDFDEHLATWLCDVYNGWVFYMHRSAICSPFVHINALYATTDLLGEPVKQTFADATCIPDSAQLFTLLQTLNQRIQI